MTPRIYSISLVLDFSRPDVFGTMCRCYRNLLPIDVFSRSVCITASVDVYMWADKKFILKFHLNKLNNLARARLLAVAQGGRFLVQNIVITCIALDIVTLTFANLTD